MSVLTKELYREAERRLYHYGELKRRGDEEREKGLVHKLDELPSNTGLFSDITGNSAARLADDAGQKWVWAIERALKAFEWCSPERAVMMRRYYALEGERLKKRVAREKLMSELCIEYTTFYEWRREIVEAVLMGALQKGAVKLY